MTQYYLPLKLIPLKALDAIKISLKNSLLPSIATLYQGSPPKTFTNDPAVSLMVEGPKTGSTK